MGLFDNFRSRDWSAPQRPAGPGHASASRYAGAGHHSAVDAGRLRELQDLSTRMQALQSEMTGLRDGYPGSRRASMPAMSPTAAYAPNAQQMPFMDTMRPGSPFQPSANVLNATSAAQAAMYGQPQHNMPPAPSGGMDLDLDSLLRDGRQARARSASVPMSPGPFNQSMPSSQPGFQPAPQPFSMPMPPGQVRTPSPVPMSSSFYDNLAGARGGGGRPMSPAFGMHDGAHHVPRTVPDIDMHGFQQMPFGSGMSPPDPINMMGSASPPNGMPYPQSAHQQFQARPQPPLPMDAFRGQGYHFPNPFAPGQGGHQGHPAYQAGFSMHQFPGMGMMDGFGAGMAGPGMHAGRPLSPRPAYGF